MEALVGMLFYDRADLARRSLESVVNKAGHPFRLATYFDGAGEGPPTCWNRILSTRKEDQHFITVDSDVFFLTNNWLDKLISRFDEYACISPVTAEPLWNQPSPGKGTVDVPYSPVGAKAYRADVLDRLGYFRVYGRYGFEDMDMAARIRGSGERVGSDREVVVDIPTPAQEDWKRELLEAGMGAFKKYEAEYAKGESLVVSAAG